MRGLRHLLHHCVALTGFCKKERKKEKKLGAFIFTRGLRHHRYHCFALRAFNASRPSQPSQPSQPSKPSQLSQPSQPSQPSSITFCFPSKFHSSFPDWLIHF